MKKILIVGASSCLGSNLATYLRRYYLVYGTYAMHRPRISEVPCFQLVLDETAPISGAIKALRPDVVVYCTDISDAEKCEKHPDLAMAVNASYAGIFASALSKYGGRLIYLSSAKVFSGKKGNYIESDPPDPQDTYGATKKRGEEIVSRYENVFILRLPTIFAIGGLNQSSMMNRLLRRLWNNEKITAVSDEYRTFISAQDVCKVVGILIDSDPMNEGIYHLGSRDADSHFGFTQKVARVFDKPIELVEPADAKDFHPPNREHLFQNICLGLNELRNSFFFEPQKTETALKGLRESLRLGTSTPVF